MKTPQTTAIHSLGVVSYYFSEDLIVRDQCPIGLSGPSGCSCNRSQPTFLFIAPVSIVYIPSPRGTATTGGTIILNSNVSNADFSSSVSSPNLTGSPIFNDLVHGGGDVPVNRVHSFKDVTHPDIISHLSHCGRIFKSFGLRRHVPRNFELYLLIDLYDIFDGFSE